MMNECSSDFQQKVHNFLEQRKKIMLQHGFCNDTKVEQSQNEENSLQNSTTNNNSGDICTEAKRVRLICDTETSSNTEVAIPANQKAITVVSNHNSASDETLVDSANQKEPSLQAEPIKFVSLQFTSEELSEKCSFLRDKKLSETGLRFSDLVSFCRQLSEQDVLFVKIGLTRKLSNELASLFAEFFETVEQYFIVPVFSQKREISVETVNFLTNLYHKTKKAQQFFALQKIEIFATNGFLSIAQNLLSEDLSEIELTQFLNFITASFDQNSDFKTIDQTLLGNVLFLLLRRTNDKLGINEKVLFDLYQKLPNKRLIKVQLKRLGFLLT